MPYLVDIGKKKTSGPSPQPSSALSPQPSGLAPMGFPRQLLAIGDLASLFGRCLDGGGGGRRREEEEDDDDDDDDY